MISKLIHYKHIFLLFVIPLIIVAIWFRGGGIIASSEEGLHLYNPKQALEFSSSPFADYSTGNTFVTFMPRKTFALLAFEADRLGIPMNLFQAALFYFLMVIAGISFYLLVIELYKKESTGPAFFSSLFYLLNPYVMSQVWRRSLYTQYFIFPFLPLALLLLVRGMKTRKVKYIVFFVFANLFFSTAFNWVTNIIVFWFVMGTYAFTEVIFTKSKTKLFKKSLYFLIVFASWIAVNSWWLMPLFGNETSNFSSGINSSENLYTLLAISSFATPGYVLRLLQGYIFVTSETFHSVYKTFVFGLLTLLLPFVAMLGIWKVKKNKTTLFFSLLLVAGFFVSIGANLPLGNIFVWIFKKIVFLQAFRNPYEKFGIVYMLAYSAFFGYGLHFIIKNARSRAGKILSTFLIIGTYGIIVWPMWTGEVLNVGGSVTVKIPEYYNELNSYLKTSDNSNYRILSIPFTQSEGVMHHWPGGNYQGVDTATHLFESTRVGSSYAFKMLEVVRKDLCVRNFSPFYSLLRTKYIVERKDVVDSDNYNDECYTNKVFMPLPESSIIPNLCNNLRFDDQTDGSSFLKCILPKENWDFRKVKYIHLVFDSDRAKQIEVAIIDKNGWRQRWNSQSDNYYQIEDGKKVLTLPLLYATEIPTAFDYSNVYGFEVINYDGTTNDTRLLGVRLDSGVEETTDEFNRVGDFGELTLFEPKNYYPAKQFGLISEIDRVADFEEFFSSAEAKRKDLDEVGFVIDEQNKNSSYNFSSKSTAQQTQILSSGKTKYWVSIEGEGPKYLLLSNTFDKNWVVIPDVDSKTLNGGLFTNWQLLGKKFLPEQYHHTVNGYANLWVLPENTKSALVIFRSQLHAEIGWFITTVVILLCVGYLVFYLVRCLLFRKTPSN